MKAFTDYINAVDHNTKKEHAHRTLSSLRLRHPLQNPKPPDTNVTFYGGGEGEGKELHQEIYEKVWLSQLRLLNPQRTQQMEQITNAPTLSFHT